MESSEETHASCRSKLLAIALHTSLNRCAVSTTLQSETMWQVRSIHPCEALRSGPDWPSQWNLSAGAAILFQLLIDQLGMSHEEIAASSLHLLGVIVRPLVETMAELTHVQAEKARVTLLLCMVPSSFHARIYG